MDAKNNQLNTIYSYVTLSKFKKAYSFIVKLFQKQPYQRENLQELFIFIVNKYADELEENQKYEDVFQCFEKGLALYPNNCDILNDTGVRLQRYGRPLEAALCFDKVLQLNQTFLKSYQNLQNTKCELIERWHFRMLNDSVRNSAYKRAINRKIDEGYCDVLDIGTGTGLLSLYALQNPKLNSIMACEGSDIMVQIADDVFSANGFENKIVLIPKYSYDLEVQSKFSLIVTETLDSGVFGEGILETLIHAKEKLMVDDGKIIPSRVSIHISGYSSKILAASNILLNDYFCTKFNLPLNCMISTEGVKCYDAEDVTRIEGYEDFELITDTVLGMTVDFNDLEDMKDYFQGKTVDEIELTVEKNGIMDGFVVWFDLELDDRDVISTNPNQNTCWNQAIFKLSSRVSVRKNGKIRLELSCKGGSLEIEHELHDDVQQYFVDENVLMFLNDIEYLNCLEKSLESIPEIENALDFSIFPYAGLLMLKEGRVKALYCSQKVEKIVAEIAQFNNFPKSSIFYLEYPSDIFIHSEPFLDLIILQFFDIFGQLNSEQLCHFKSLESKLKPGGIVIPNQVDLYGIIMKSEWLVNCSQIRNKEVVGFKIDKFFENFVTDNHLDLGYFQHEDLSETIKLAEVIKDGYLHETKKTVNLKHSCDKNEINALLYFYNIHFQENQAFLCTNRPHSHIKRSAFIVPRTADSKMEISTNSIIVDVIQNHGVIKCILNI